MRKRLTKHLAFLMAALMILTSINPMTVSAATASEVDGGYATTYSLTELTNSANWDAAVSNDGTNTTIAFTGQYQQAFFEVPAAVIAAGFQKFQLNFAAGSNANSLCLKLEPTVGGTELEVVYWTNELTVPASATLTTAQVDFMSLSEEASSYTVSSITFYTDNAVEGVGDDEEPDEKPGETPEVPDFGDPVVAVTDTAIEISGGITVANKWNSSDTQKNIVSFGSQYNEYVYTLAEAVDFATVENVVLEVQNQQQEFAVKFYDAAGTEVKAQYGLNGSATYTIAPTEGTTGSLASVAVMSTASADAVAYPYSVTLKKITINLKEAPAQEDPGDEEPDEDTEEEPEVPDFGDPVEKVTDSGMEISGTISFQNRWSGAPMGNIISYSSQYEEYVLTLPQSVDMDKVISVTVEVENQGGPMACKLYDSGNNELQGPAYGLSGKTSYTINATGSGTLSAIALMSMSTDAFKVTIKSVTVEAEPGSLTPAEDLKTEVSDIKLYNRHTNEDCGGNTATFEKQWNEFAFNLPEAVDLEKLDSITIKVKDQGGAVTFKLYNEDKSSELAQFWTQNGKTSYTLTTTNSGICTSVGLMAHDPSGKANEYPFSITIESVTVKMLPDTGEETVEKGVEYDIDNLRDKVGALLGEDFRIGTAISYQEFADSMEMELVTKHFNSVTLGNELKPDSLLKATAERQEVTINGTTIEVPVLDYSNPERYLDYFYNWNQEHPDNQIKIRGHVLVWHSQMPEFYFHEDYDTSKPYVTGEVMNLRLEYYIKSVAEHFTAADSKYCGMFYGWDVVNEAVSDSTGTYRNASENSSWWAVYQSPEFIMNAFVYANKYFPADVELYYNDYNETGETKSQGIAALLTAVKNTPGARIDAMGMQGHYQISQNPTAAQFSKAARLYAGIVGAVQVTELDFKGASSATDERLAQRYTEIYDSIRRLIADGVNVSGMTIWGVVDKHSWLQTANTAGGGSSTNSKQYPLLFDNNYKAKEAFYAIANAGFLAPEIKSVSLVEAKDGSFITGNTYTLKNGATFTPVWDETGVKVKVSAPGATSATVYVSVDGSISTAEAALTNGEAVITVPVSLNGAVKLDVVVDGTAYNDTTLNQAASDEYYAEASLTKATLIDKGTVTVDGDASDAAWAKAASIPLTISLGASVSAEAKALWDENYLYVLVNVTDSVLNKDSSDAYQQDSLELFIDENNHKSETYEADDKQYRVNYDNEQSFNGSKCNADNIVSSTALTETGYIVEAAFKWTDITAAKGTVIGLEFQINDADASGKRIGTLSWNDTTGTGYACPGVLGTAVLVDTTPAPAPVSNNTATTTTTTVQTVTQEVDLLYTVVRGDSMCKIAKKYGLTLAELVAMNPQITNASRIYVGQQIIVGKTTEEVPADQAASTEPASEKLVYVVRKGDYLYKIARKNKISLKDLLAMNPQIKNANRIFVGQEIIVSK